MKVVLIEGGGGGESHPDRKVERGRPRSRMNGNRGNDGGTRIKWGTAIKKHVPRVWNTADQIHALMFM